MKRIEISDSWGRLIRELAATCDEQRIPLSDLTDWMRNTIEEIERKTFHYYITSGETREFPGQKVDITILLEDLHGFTIFTDKREYHFYPMRHLIHFEEDISGNYITHHYFYSEEFYLVIEDKIANAAKLKLFSQRVLSLSGK